MEEKIRIIHQPSTLEPYLIIYKKSNLPSAPLKEGEDNNAFFYASKLFPQVKNIRGKKECEHGLLHRLDTQTEGLLMIAASQDFYDFMEKEQEEGRFIKSYQACSKFVENNRIKKEAFPPLDLDVRNKQGEFILSSYFRNFGEKSREVRPVLKDSSKILLKKVGKLKEYQTQIQILSFDRKNETLRTFCRIKEGFRHQVRCHLAWLNIPVIGDPLYNSEYQGEKLEFYASGLEFTNPVNGEKVEIKLNL